LIAGFIYIFSQPVAVSKEFDRIDTSFDPVQSSRINELPYIIQLKNGKLNIVPLAEYEVSAKVVSKAKYFKGWDSKISKYDFALAWGKLAEPEMKKFIKYSQWGRFYFFRYKWNCPVSEDYISTHSSNHHLIAANKNISRALRNVRKNKLIILSGYLVNVSGTYKDSNVKWKSSLIRNDTGDGACEILYVKKVRYGNKVYE